MALRSLSPAEIQFAGGASTQAITLDAACEYLLSTRGKQLRSSIVLEAARQGPRAGDPPVRRAALAVELLHLASLAHDDVVDDGHLRRGQPSVSAEHGNVAATMTGGWVLGRALELVSGCGEEAVRLFSEAAGRLCEGEMLEFQDLYDVERSRKRYLMAIDAKTAAAFELSGELGASVGGAPAEAVARLGVYGRELGLAVQIADDLLDLLADDEMAGKTAGGDLRQGVYTLPVIYALEESPELREPLRRPLGRAELDRVLDAVLETSGVERAFADCQRHLAAAKAAAVGLPGTEPLIGIADAALAPLEKVLA